MHRRNYETQSQIQRLGIEGYKKRLSVNQKRQIEIQNEYNLSKEEYREKLVNK